MIRDRLKEFRAAGGLDDEMVTITAEASEEQVELLSLLEKIGLLYIKLKEMKNSVNSLRSLIYEHDSKARLDDEFSRLKSDARKLRGSLDEVKQVSNKSTGNVVQHAAKSHHFSLVLNLTLVLQELSAIQADTQDRHHQYVRKEILITKGSIDESELESLLDKSTEVFTQDLIKETQVARQQLQDLQERHEAVIKLEKSIGELWQLFQDVALLVEQQGETINRIEQHVFVAQEKMVAAKKELGEALDNQKKAMKKKFICGIILAVVVLIIVLIIIFSFI